MRWRILVTLLAAICGAIYLGNAPWLSGAAGEPILLAHRGVAQQFRRNGLTSETCTAAQSLPPTHSFLENTIPSIKAAFAYGADVVEIDIHPTIDGEFAVFHDWRLECRTDGRGVTREQTMTYLKTLDIGFGYTADDGVTFPFRGRLRGAMPSLAEVLDAFPSARFLVNIKSNDRGEADRVVSYLRDRRADTSRLMFYGGHAPIARLRTLLPNVRLLSRPQLRSCLVGYFLTGWFGQVPDACRNSVVFVPINYRALFWGWPNLFVERMRDANADVFVIGPYTRDTDTSGTTSVDDPGDVSPFIDGYAGGIATDRIEIMGPYIRVLSKRKQGT